MKASKSGKRELWFSGFQEVPNYTRMVLPMKVNYFPNVFRFPNPQSLTKTCPMTLTSLSDLYAKGCFLWVGNKKKNLSITPLFYEIKKWHSRH